MNHLEKKILIRRAQEGDKAAVIKLINRIMSAEFAEDQAAYPTADIESLEKSYGQIGDAFFVAQHGPDIIGTVAIKKEDDRVALLRRLFVSADFRHQKIGLQLVERALQFCQEVGYQEVVFKTTSRMQGAVHLCQRKGFVQRAKLSLGSVELFKFVLPLRDLRPAASV